MTTSTTAPQLTTLANGLRILTDPMGSVDSVSLGMWIGAGARHENPETGGVAHLLEHMAFKGTSRRDALAIAEEIEDVGGHLNAYTAREQTAYYAKVLKEDAPLAIDLLGDILQNSRFDADELARERTVVLQEIGQAADTPDDIIFDDFQETAYPDQAIGRPVLGRAEVVAQMDRQAIVDFIAQNYGADRMVFAAAGNIAHQAVVDMVGVAFENLPAKSRASSQPAIYRGGDHRQEKDLEQAHLIIGFDGVAFDDPDFYALQVFSTIFGGGMSSRLFQEVREKRGLVYSIYSFASSFLDGGIFGIYAGTGPNEVDQLVPVLADEIVKAAGSISAAELARAKAQLKSGLLMSRESTSNRAEQLAQHMLVRGRIASSAEIVAKVDAIDLDAIAEVATRLRRSPPTVAATGPLAKLEDYETIRARLK
ncbi:MAG: peptidase M16 [Nisaea sp.]|jgi:predicted Zn-dependent peptidase|nr:peptidase M16 [Nisaea sp.]OUX98024.1 MAG: peptidase M16 [Candidatus Endolissoclinum sp. TMED26]